MFHGPIAITIAPQTAERRRGGSLSALPPAPPPSISPFPTPPPRRAEGSGFIKTGPGDSIGRTGHCVRQLPGQPLPLPALSCLSPSFCCVEWQERHRKARTPSTFVLVKAEPCASNRAHSTLPGVLGSTMERSQRPSDKLSTGQVQRGHSLRLSAICSFFSAQLDLA